MSAIAEPLLAAKSLTKRFDGRAGLSWLRGDRSVKHAVSNVSFALAPGEVLGIVGESGSGKTTVAKMLMRLVEPSSGRVTFKGRDVHSLTPNELAAQFRPAVRMIFQDPDAVLNPAYTIGAGLKRAIRLHSDAPDADLDRIVHDSLEQLGLDSTFTAKFPQQMSGGQKRRVGICRALLTDPEVIVADEPLSGLDVVLQEQVLSAIKVQQVRRNFALVLISHDLDRVNQICDRALVMYAGRVVEEIILKRGAAPVRDQYRHPYSIVLQQARVDSPAKVSAMLLDDEPLKTRIATEPPGNLCSFSPLCARRVLLERPSRCESSAPEPTPVEPRHLVACHFPDHALE